MPDIRPMAIDAHWLGDETLTTLQLGMVLRLRAAMWRGMGSLPTDETILRGIAQVRPEDWHRHRDVVLAQFVPMVAEGGSRITWLGGGGA